MTEIIAQFVGAYILELFFAVLIIILGMITLSWRLFELYATTLWHQGRRLWNQISYSALAQWIRQRAPQRWIFLGRRLAPASYLWLHLALGILLLTVAGNLFAEIAEEVVQRDTLFQFDQTLATALHQNTKPIAVTTFIGITHMGNVSVLAALSIGVGVILLFRRRWLLLIGWSVTITGGGLLNSGLKNLFQRVRPELPNPFITESGWSFPSGHAMGSLIVYGMLTYLLVLVLNRLWSKLILVAMVTLVMLIGLSRLYLGVHFFSDVLAGYAAGITWLAICISGTEVARQRKEIRVRKSSDRAKSSSYRRKQAA